MIYRLGYIVLIVLLTACQQMPAIFQPAQQPETANAGSIAKPEPVKTGLSAPAVTENNPEPGPITPGPVEVPAMPANLWPRFQSGLQLEYNGQPRVQQNIDWYIKNRYILERSQQRIGYYIFFIMDELEKQGVPFDIALIPLIESQFNPFASSGLPAGMWQFMPGTGRRFNLVNNSWYDGRRDPVESTKAVATYFRYLMNYFNNDLLLALAAYNSGEGTVQNAIDRNIRAGKPTDFWHLNLPAVTTNYIPKVVALAEIFRHPEKYNLVLNSIEDKPYFATIRIDNNISLEQVSAALHISREEMYFLNAGIRRNARPNHNQYAVNIPASKMDGVWDSLEKIPQITTVYVAQKKHLVKNGETLGSIANKYKVSVQQLKQWNKLRSDIIVAGRTLQIAQSQSQPQSAAPLPKAKTPSKKAPAGGIVQHKVKSGESLWKIAQTYKVKADSLAKWNKKSATTPLKPGEILVVYTNAKH